MLLQQLPDGSALLRALGRHTLTEQLLALVAHVDLAPKKPKLSEAEIDARLKAQKAKRKT